MKKMSKVFNKEIVLSWIFAIRRGNAKNSLCNKKHYSLIGLYKIAIVTKGRGNETDSKISKRVEVE